MENQYNAIEEWRGSAQTLIRMSAFGHNQSDDASIRLPNSGRFRLIILVLVGDFAAANCSLDW